VPVDEIAWMLEQYRAHHQGWTVKHFHEHLQERHSFRWSYTWTKTQLHAAGLVERAKRRGAHRRKRERKPCEGMMLHQNGSRHGLACGASAARHDRHHGMDDATRTIYSAFLVEEEGTISTFCGLLEVIAADGLALYQPRQPLFLHQQSPGRRWTRIANLHSLENESERRKAGGTITTRVI
jgi:hypothetical protein